MCYTSSLKTPAKKIDRFIMVLKLSMSLPPTKIVKTMQNKFVKKSVRELERQLCS